MRPPREEVVCDASVAIAWLLEEVAPLWVTAFRDRVTARQIQIRVPTLFWLEIGNRVVRTSGVTDAHVLEAFVRLEGLGFETIEMDRPQRLMAVHLARRFRLSVYDAVYLALAETADLPLATLDGRLADPRPQLGAATATRPGTTSREGSTSRMPHTAAWRARPIPYPSPPWAPTSRSCARQSARPADPQSRNSGCVQAVRPSESSIRARTYRSAPRSR